MKALFSKLLLASNSVIQNPAEYLAMAAAAVIAGLVAALQLQGTKLHRAQVKLLAVQLQSKQDRAAEDVASTKDAYRDALNTFIQAGGKLLLIAALLLPPLNPPASAQQQQVMPPDEIVEPQYCKGVEGKGCIRRA